MAPNKFLAKIASGWRKPDGLTVIPPERVEAFLQQLPVDALWGVGPVPPSGSERRVAAEVDIRAADPELEKPSAAWPTGCSAFHGDDPRPVVPHRAAKSASSETTYAEDLQDMERIREELVRLARETAEWLEGRSSPAAP